MFTWNTILALKLSYLGPTGPGPGLMLGGCLIVNNIAILKLIHKGQIISECLFDVFQFSKKFDKFLPKNLKSGQIIK